MLIIAILAMIRLQLPVVLGSGNPNVSMKFSRRISVRMMELLARPLVARE
jgi:hypothetical protein